MKFNFFTKRSNTTTSEYTPNACELTLKDIFANAHGQVLAVEYRCINLIADTIGSLDIDVLRKMDDGSKEKWIDHKVQQILSGRPNKRQTKSQWLKAMIVAMLTKGVGYSYIVRDANGNAEQFVYIPSSQVTIIEPNPNDYFSEVKYNINGLGVVEACNLLVITNSMVGTDMDGLHSRGVKDVCFNAFDLATKSDEQAKRVVKNGFAIQGFITKPERFIKGQREEFQTAWSNTISQGGTPILDSNMEFHPLSNSPEQSQMLSSREYNIVEICRAYGVPPILAGDYSHVSYSTLEQTLLQFYSTRIQHILTNIEEEIKTKAFLPSQQAYVDVVFNVDALLRTDRKSLAEYYSKMLNGGFMTINEIRHKMDMSNVDGGDTTCVQSNLISLDKALTQDQEKAQQSMPMTQEQKDSKEE